MWAEGETPAYSEATKMPHQISTHAPVQTYKSFKKKYNKMRHVFKDKMKDSNALFAQEQKTAKLARRLQEQNDQLLELLLQVNQSSKIAPHLRYDLHPRTPSESAVPGLEPDMPSQNLRDKIDAEFALREAKREQRAGGSGITEEMYLELEAQAQAAASRSRSLTDLSTLPHTMIGGAISATEIPGDIADPIYESYLTPEHEDEYLATLDATFEGTTPQLESHPIRSNEKEREIALRNPVSVYNWLRRNEPHVFLQDGNPQSDAPVQKSKEALKEASKHLKRASIVAKQEPKHDPEAIDEDGFVAGGVMEAPTKAKRKRDDEPYRPKGGSSRPYKKKKVGGGVAERRLEDA